jgi:hypothetical protein
VHGVSVAEVDVRAGFDRNLEAARAASVPRHDAVPTFREPTRMEAMP